MADITAQALANHLASITDDEERTRFLRQARMLAANAAPDEAFEPDVRSLRDYLATPIPIPPSLVWPTIAVRGEVTTTLGRAGKGKTTLNLNRIFAWACGNPLFPGWQGKDQHPESPLFGQMRDYLAPTGPLKTLIAENEGNAGMFHEKVKLMLKQGPLDAAEQELCLDNLFIHGDGGYSGLKLDNDAGVSKLRAAVEKVQPDIIFIEPFRSLWQGEENSSTDMNKVVDAIIAMATDYNCAVILSHHERKSGAGEDGEKMSAGRGSTVLEGAVAVMENFEAVKDGEYREMSWSKARYLPPPTPVRMEYERESNWYSWIPQSNIDDAIISALRDADDEPLNLTGLAEETGETKSKLRPRVELLAKDGRVKKMPNISTQHGSTGTRYRLPTGDGDDQGGLPV